jgi:hypothetical protein
MAEARIVLREHENDNSLLLGRVLMLLGPH